MYEQGNVEYIIENIINTLYYVNNKWIIHINGEFVNVYPLYSTKANYLPLN